MFLKLVIRRDDLCAFVARWLPCTVQLGDPGSRREIEVSELTELTLVPDMGLRVACKAQVRWPLLPGVDAPISVTSLQLSLAPEVKETVLCFRPRLEHADLAVLPHMLDEAVTRGINARFEEKASALAWDFGHLLGWVFPLPPRVDPIDAIATRATTGTVRITANELVLRVPMRAQALRHGERRPKGLRVAGAKKQPDGNGAARAGGRSPENQPHQPVRRK
jgi:hypothetical protein